jgi:spore cortex biosynthesis protein YabQ
MTLSTQFMTMLAMIGMGTFFGITLDTYNRFLQRSKRKSWLVFINDVLFWVFQGLFIFYVLFQINQGEWRFYIFLALFCGFAFYQGLCKEIYLKSLEKLILMAIRISKFCVRLFYVLIYKPIAALISLLISTILVIGTGLLSLLKWCIRCIWFMFKLIWKPMLWALLLFWKIVPKNIKKFVEKLYNKGTGKLKQLKNIINKLISRWKKKE